MRRMISGKLITWIKSLFDKLIFNKSKNQVEIGTDVEIDGDIKVNGAENLTDKDGNPLDLGGTKLYKHSVQVHPIGAPEDIHEDFDILLTKRETEYNGFEDICTEINNSVMFLGKDTYGNYGFLKYENASVFSIGNTTLVGSGYDTFNDIVSKL